MTLLLQDSIGGLQVKNTRRVDRSAADRRLARVGNIGDMLDRLTGGRYRSTPHRVRNTSGVGRLSYPFFFDPGFDAEIKPLPQIARSILDDYATRWDRASVHDFSGTYGAYLLGKVSKVFPGLKQEVLGQPAIPDARAGARWRSHGGAMPSNLAP